MAKKKKKNKSIQSRMPAAQDDSKNRSVSRDAGAKRAQPVMEQSTEKPKTIHNTIVFALGLFCLIAGFLDLSRVATTAAPILIIGGYGLIFISLIF